MGRAPEPSPTRRWALVNERLRQEAQEATLEKKFAQLSSLMASVDYFRWRKKLEAEDDRVRDLWVKLRAAWARRG